MSAPGGEKARPDGALLTVEGLRSAYGRIEVLHGIDLHVAAGEIVALIGGNGAGKTTLLRALSGVQPVATGRVTFDETDITHAAPHDRVVAGIAQVPEGRQVFGPLSVTDNLRLGAYRRRQVAGDLERMHDMFPILAEKAHLPAASLSGGQQQMLALARALMSRPRLLLLDEPSMGLAPVLVEQIMRTVAQLREEGVTILLVEQNAFAALDVADRAYVIETGRVSAQGPAADIRDDPDLRAAYLGV